MRKENIISWGWVKNTGEMIILERREILSAEGEEYKYGVGSSY